LYKLIFFVNSVRIFVKFPKIFVQRGISVDLFAVECKDLCPVTVLKSLKKHKQACKDSSSPVFMFNNKKLLTQNVFNTTLRNLLKPFFGEEAICFSSHSFRPAIPATLANHPKIASNEDIMGWGRWDSKAYKAYTRLKQNKHKETFKAMWAIINVRFAIHFGQ
jgi:DNA-binding transcriptional regulator/RsmH inhibitor MraZ